MSEERVTMRKIKDMLRLNGFASSATDRSLAVVGWRAVPWSRCSGGRRQRDCPAPTRGRG